jgi:hypothetical protein
MKIQTAASSRTATITIDPGETLNSLTTKINAELGGNGKASVNFASGGEGLEISVNSGVSATLIPGPADSDALGRLGLAAGVITKAAASSSTSSSSTAATTTPSATSQTFGLGITSNMDLTNTTDAGAARATLINVLASIRNIYQTTNTPASSTSTTGTSSTSGTAPSYLTSQLANYNIALSMLSSASSSSTTTSSSTSSLI